MSFSSYQREEYVKQLSQGYLDLLIIGGGITGAGIAFDASLRGLKVGLIEMQDFAAGTSSRSTKLVHGGLRYMKQLDFRVVGEVGKERAIVYENAPHVTIPEKMLLPFYKGGTFGKRSTAIGLKLYDYLAGVKKSERRFMLNKAETLKREPLLKEKGLVGSGVYVEYKTDDARLTLEILKKATEYGAIAINYVKAEDFIYQNRKVIGIKARDLVTNELVEIHARKIINSTGPWVDSLREWDSSKSGKHLLLTKGVHLVFSRRVFPLTHAVYFDAPDGRMIFAIPRDDKTYIGTTDTVFKGDLSKPKMTSSDREYLLEAIDFMFPDLHIDYKDIEASWAGIRALVHEEGKAPSEISRRDEIFISDSGLISIAGGKLTGYRKMAEKIVNIVTAQLLKEDGLSFNNCQTLHARLSGGDVGGSVGFDRFVKEKAEEGVRELDLGKEDAYKLVKRYGSNIKHIYSYMKEYTVENLSEQSNLSQEVYATLKYSIEKEMTLTPLDYFHRRTSALLFDRAYALKWKDPVIEFMAMELNWDERQKVYYKNQLEKELQDSIIPIDEA